MMWNFQIFTQLIVHICSFFKNLFKDYIFTVTKFLCQPLHSQKFWNPKASTISMFFSFIKFPLREIFLALPARNYSVKTAFTFLIFFFHFRFIPQDLLSLHTLKRDPFFKMLFSAFFRN